MPSRDIVLKSTVLSSSCPQNYTTNFTNIIWFIQLRYMCRLFRLHISQGEIINSLYLVPECWSKNAKVRKWQRLKCEIFKLRKPVRNWVWNAKMKNCENAKNVKITPAFISFHCISCTSSFPLCSNQQHKPDLCYCCWLSYSSV